MSGASRPGAHFRVDFDDATFAEDLEHTSSDTGRELAQRERDKLTDEGLPPDQLKRCDTESRDGTSLPQIVVRKLLHEHRGTGAYPRASNSRGIEMTLLLPTRRTLTTFIPRDSPAPCVQE
jgi:hypothetical protein